MRNRASPPALANVVAARCTAFHRGSSTGCGGSCPDSHDSAISANRDPVDGKKSAGRKRFVVITRSLAMSLKDD